MLYSKKIAVNGSATPARDIGQSLVPTKVESFVSRWSNKDVTPNITTTKDGTIVIPGALAKTKRNAAIMKSFDNGQQLCSACMYAKPSRDGDQGKFISNPTIYPGGGGNDVSVTDTEVKSNSNSNSDFDFEFEINSTTSRTAFLVVNFSTWHVNQTLQVSASPASQSRDHATSIYQYNNHKNNNDGVKAQAQTLIDVPVHLTFGYWNLTRPVALSLSAGLNVMQFTRGNSTRGIAIKEIFLQSNKK